MFSNHDCNLIRPAPKRPFKLLDHKGLLILILLSAAPLSVCAESILSRAEADHIFTLDRAGWEVYAERIGVPAGWRVDLKPLDTGTKLVAADRMKGIVLSMQPFYDNDQDPPGMLIVGSNYPRGTYPELSDERKQDLETEVSMELGSAYSVLISFKETTLIEGFAIIVTKQ